MKKMCVLVLVMLMVFLAGCVTVPVETPAFPGFVLMVNGETWLTLTPQEQIVLVAGYLNGQFDIASRAGRWEELRDDVGIPLKIFEIVELITVWYQSTGSLGAPFIEVFRAIQAQDWEALMEEAEQPTNAPIPGGV